VGQATDDYMVHAHWMLDNKRYKHTLKMCNTFCFSTATVIARMHLSVTLYIRCLSCYVFKWTILLVSKYIIIPFYQVTEHDTCWIESQHPQGHHMRPDMLRDTICRTPSAICYWYSFRIALILHTKIITNLRKHFTPYFTGLRKNTAAYYK
jgi:hypothetical protein